MILEFILICTLITPDRERRHFKWYPESRAQQCVDDRKALDATLPKVGPGQVRARYYVCRCRSCGEPWP